MKVAKRAIDVFASAVGLAVTVPLYPLIGAAIWLDSPGPLFYRQKRAGELLGSDGPGRFRFREFQMLKFRTMFEGADRQKEALEQTNEAGGALFKIRDDPRVTQVGRLLRRFSLDEIPNVINVLRGEMSLVGPRPLPTRDFNLLEAWHRRRYNVLPGMTGLWQVSGRSDLSFDDLVRLDFYYLENWSIWLDITIMFKTPFVVVARRGAY